MFKTFTKVKKMAIIYYYVPKKDINKIKEGINIENHANKSLIINGVKKPGIIGYLSPKDDYMKYLSEEYTCLELDVDVNYCFVLDGDMDLLEEKNFYYNSMISLNDYRFGRYRNPEVVVLCDVAHKNITPFNKIIGNPLVFDTSDGLYKCNLFEELKQRYNDFDETMLGIFFMLMSHKGRFKLLGKKKLGKKMVYIYQDSTTQKIYTVDVLEGLSNNR